MNCCKLVLVTDPTALAGIVQLAERVWHAHYPGIISQAQIDFMLAWMYDPDRLRREWQEGMRFWQALLQDQLVGFSAAGAVTGTADQKEWMVHKLYVDPDFQRQGVGARLLRQAELDGREHGCRSLVLTVNKANHQALAAYRKFGLTTRCAVCSDIGGGFFMDDFVLAKSIPLASSSEST